MLIHESRESEKYFNRNHHGRYLRNCCFCFSARERHSSGGRKSVLSTVSDESEEASKYSADSVLEKVGSAVPSL
jgi:biotin synthase-related radical SAM superfamily protein